MIDEIHYNRSLTVAEQLEQGRKALELLEQMCSVEKDVPNVGRCSQSMFERLSG